MLNAKTATDAGAIVVAAGSCKGVAAVRSPRMPQQHGASNREVTGAEAAPPHPEWQPPMAGLAQQVASALAGTTSNATLSTTAANLKVQYIWQVRSVG
jgi:hypothetical protein